MSDFNNPITYILWAYLGLLCTASLRSVETLALSRFYSHSRAIPFGMSSGVFHLSSNATHIFIIGISLLAVADISLAGYSPLRAGFYCLILFACCSLNNLNKEFGLDAVERSLVFLTLFLALAHLDSGGHSAVIVLNLFFAHLCLNYGLSGLTKLACEDWRSGAALKQIVQSGSFRSENKLFRSLSQNQNLTRGASFSVISFECLFPLIALFPELSLAMLIFGFGMHLGIALTMGLNDFLLLYLSLYPSVIYFSSALSS